jgi:wyosine [tRNA(Phe)-imidazoG37] synthetase (radical SAM superfamily)
LHRLAIGYNDLAFCINLANKVTFIENFKYTENENVTDLYLKKRQEFINKNKISYANEKCLQCPIFIEDDWNETPGINHLYIANRTFCSCNCTYCYISDNGNQDKKRENNTNKPWNVINFLKEFEDKNLITDDCHVILSGGNPEEYPKDELNWLLDFATKKNRSLEILTAGMFYSKEIEKVLKEKKNIIVNISVDSGNKETYYKIKQVKYFDKVWENIEKYKKIAKNNNDIVVKYILIDGINDDDNNINSFFELCDKIGINEIKLVLEFYFAVENKNKLFPIQYVKALRKFLNNPKVTIKNREKFKTNITCPANVFNSKVLAYIKYFIGNVYVKFDTTKNINWKIFQKYMEYSKENDQNTIIAKYLIKKGENNSEEEITNFKNKCNSYGCYNIEFEEV